MFGSSDDWRGRLRSHLESASLERAVPSRWFGRSDDLIALVIVLIVLASIAASYLWLGAATATAVTLGLLVGVAIIFFVGKRFARAHGKEEVICAPLLDLHDLELSRPADPDASPAWDEPVVREVPADPPKTEAPKAVSRRRKSVAKKQPRGKLRLVAGFFGGAVAAAVLVLIVASVLYGGYSLAASHYQVVGDEARFRTGFPELFGIPAPASKAEHALVKDIVHVRVAAYRQEAEAVRARLESLRRNAKPGDPRELVRLEDALADATYSAGERLERSRRAEWMESYALQRFK